MPFGDILRKAYEKATIVSRESAALVATGVDLIGQEAMMTAEKATTKTKELADIAFVKGKQLISETGKSIAENANSAAQVAKKVYREVEREATDAVVGGAVAACSYKDYAVKKYNEVKTEGLKNAKNRRNRNDVAYDAKKEIGLGQNGRMNHAFGDETISNDVERNLGVKASRTKEDSIFYFGDNDNNIRIAYLNNNFSAGYEYDFEKNNVTYGLSRGAEFGAFSKRTQWNEYNGLFQGNSQTDILSGKVEVIAGYVKSPSYQEVKVALDLEANIIKFAASRQANITPATVYNNTLGKAVGYFSPQYSELNNPLFDHGFFMGGEVQAGIGAALKASAELDLKNMSFKAGTVLGAGPMAGVSLIFGLK